MFFYVNPTGADGVGVTSLIYLHGSDGMTVNQSRVCSVDMVATYKIWFVDWVSEAKSCWLLQYSYSCLMDSLFVYSGIRIGSHEELCSKWVGLGTETRYQYGTGTYGTQISVTHFGAMPERSVEIFVLCFSETNVRSIITGTWKIISRLRKCTWTQFGKL